MHTTSAAPRTARQPTTTPFHCQCSHAARQIAAQRAARVVDAEEHGARGRRGRPEVDVALPSWAAMTPQKSPRASAARREDQRREVDGSGQGPATERAASTASTTRRQPNRSATLPTSGPRSRAPTSGRSAPPRHLAPVETAGARGGRSRTRSPDEDEEQHAPDGRRLLEDPRIRARRRTAPCAGGVLLRRGIRQRAPRMTRGPREAPRARRSAHLRPTAVVAARSRPADNHRRLTSDECRAHRPRAEPGRTPRRRTGRRPSAAPACTVPEARERRRVMPNDGARPAPIVGRTTSELARTSEFCVPSGRTTAPTPTPRRRGRERRRRASGQPGRAGRGSRGRARAGSPGSST